jgi:hypothetical protein
MLKKNIYLIISVILFIIFISLIIYLFVTQQNIINKCRDKDEKDKKDEKNKNKSTNILNTLPNEIIFIRHGEKKNKHDVGDLSKTGEIHAKCWVDFFTDDQNLPSTIGIPNALYAMKQGHKKTSSNRPYETILPLSQKLNLQINNNYLRDDSSGVITDILNNNAGKNVLVCWEHEAIVDLVNEIIQQVYISNDKDCNLKIKNWGGDIMSKKDDNNDYSTIWQIKFEESSIKVYVYPGCAVDDSKNCNFYITENKNPTFFSC